MKLNCKVYIFICLGKFIISDGTTSTDLFFSLSVLHCLEKFSTRLKKSNKTILHVCEGFGASKSLSIAAAHR